MCLVRDGRYRPTLPVECPILEIGDLRRQRWVEMKNEIRSKTQAQVPKNGDLICASVSGQERVRWVGAAIQGEVINELF